MALVELALVGEPSRCKLDIDFEVAAFARQGLRRRAGELEPSNLQRCQIQFDEAAGHGWRRAVAEALGLPHTSATTFSGSEKIGHYG